MFIDSNHPVVKALMAEWNHRTSSTDSEDRGFVSMSNALKERLADQILALIASSGGQLILMYHEFLTLEPSGAHSFAYGSEMQSKTIYWTHVARLPVSPTMLKQYSPGAERNLGEQMKIRFAPSTTYLIPVAWQWALYPFYPNCANRPSFGFTEPRNQLNWLRTPKPEVLSVPSPDPLNISGLGDHLFRFKEGRYDWATKICFVVGTEAVGKWLTEHRSQEAFNQLVNH